MRVNRVGRPPVVEVVQNTMVFSSMDVLEDLNNNGFLPK